MDYVTALPFSNSYTVILTMEDCFSKMSHLVPLTKATFCQGDCKTGGPSVWYPRRCGLAQGATVYFCLLKGVLQSVVGYCQFVHRIPSPVQWTRNEDEPGPGDRPSFHGVSRSLLLVPNLVCVEYVHNSLTISASGLSPFLCVYGYQTPLLPALNREVSCPSALAYAQRC